MTPRFSIIIPVYNVEKYLGNCLESIDRQTFRDFETILVDDGSTDASPQLCDRYAASRPNARAVHQANRGLTGARNRGLDEATGEYIVYIDSDDTLQPCALELFDRAISAHSSPDLVGAGYMNVSEDNVFRESTPTDKETIYSDLSLLQDDFLTRKKIVLAPGTALRRDWLADNGIRFKKMPFSEDISFIWMCLANARSAVFIDRKIYNYLQRQGSIMHTVDADNIIEAYSVYCRIEKELTPRPNVSKTTKCFLKSRWMMGALRTAARRGLCFRDFENLMAEMDGECNIQALKHFPDIKVRMLAYLHSISPRLFHKAMAISL